MRKLAIWALYRGILVVVAGLAPMFASAANAQVTPSFLHEDLGAVVESKPSAVLGAIAAVAASEARALSHAGHVAGSYTDETTGRKRAVLWEIDAQSKEWRWFDLGGFVGGEFASEALDVNDSGVTVGTVTDAFGNKMGITWTRDPAGNWSFVTYSGVPTGINNGGEIALTKSLEPHRISWKPNANGALCAAAPGPPPLPPPLPVLGGTGRINDQGDVVGFLGILATVSIGTEFDRNATTVCRSLSTEIGEAKDINKGVIHEPARSHAGRSAADGPADGSRRWARGDLIGV